MEWHFVITVLGPNSHLCFDGTVTADTRESAYRVIRRVIGETDPRAQRAPVVNLTLAPNQLVDVDG